LGIKADQSGYDRKYLGVTDEELLKVTDVLKKSIGFDIARGDMISVKHLQIDRSKQFEAEDEELSAQIARRKLSDRHSDYAHSPGDCLCCLHLH
jgi:flagellar M-ring protein FliF